MDAYVVVNDGSADIRTVQQWLNARHWTQPWARIAPCDGRFSRDVQKAPVRALQAEMGFTESNITGSVGPLTRQALASHTQIHRQLSGNSGGWAGDLATFACEYTSSTGLGPREFCRQRLAKVGVTSSSSMPDLIEDLDGRAVGNLVRSGMTFPDALASRLSSGGPSATRFRDFVAERFGISHARPSRRPARCCCSTKKQAGSTA